MNSWTSHRQLTDETAAETNRYDYDAWLQIRSSTGTVTNPQTGKGLFSAYRREDDGLYGTHNRFYEADSGRWMSADPAEADLNLYRYVNNNPINNDDPSGLEGERTRHDLQLEYQERLMAVRRLEKQLAAESDPKMREYLQQSIATHLEIMEVLRSQAGIERDVYRRMKSQEETGGAGTRPGSPGNGPVHAVDPRRSRSLAAAFRQRQVDIVEGAMEPGRSVTEQRANRNRAEAIVQRANSAILAPVVYIYRTIEVGEAALDGVRTGTTAVINGSATAIVNTATLGTNDRAIELLEVTEKDRQAGYDTAVAFATAGGEILIGVISGGAASALAKGGKVARIAGGGLVIFDAAGNTVGFVRGIVDIGEQGGLTVQNVLQILGSAGGLAGNVSPLLRGRPKLPSTRTTSPPPRRPPTGAEVDEFVDVPENLPGSQAVPARIGPKGRRTRINPDDAPENIRALTRENESADILHRHGYDVEQNPTVPGSKNPDYLINGEVYDNFAPTTRSARNIHSVVKEKLLSGQSSRVVLNLDDSPVTLEALRKQFADWPISGLQDIIIVRNGQAFDL